MNKFAERLRELRIEKNLSQRGLAKETGVSQAAIARWESNLQVPNIDVAIMFAQYFQVTTDYLLGLEN
ncbi:MAG: helix-turn-helix transcriptional regulator [Clostridia bacterium]|nr:helix-turn-helix transcriptional regulator [Clostridia bacterium]